MPPSCQVTSAGPLMSGGRQNAYRPHLRWAAIVRAKPPDTGQSDTQAIVWGLAAIDQGLVGRRRHQRMPVSYFRSSWTGTPSGTVTVVSAAALITPWTAWGTIA